MCVRRGLERANENRCAGKRARDGGIAVHGRTDAAVGGVPRGRIAAVGTGDKDARRRADTGGADGLQLPTASGELSSL